MQGKGAQQASEQGVEADGALLVREWQWKRRSLTPVFCGLFEERGRQTGARLLDQATSAHQPVTLAVRPDVPPLAFITRSLEFEGDLGANVLRAERGVQPMQPEARCASLSFTCELPGSRDAVQFRATSGLLTRCSGPSLLAVWFRQRMEEHAKVLGTLFGDNGMTGRRRSDVLPYTDDRIAAGSTRFGRVTLVGTRQQHQECTGHGRSHGPSRELVC
jgi:hypothetical protein